MPISYPLASPELFGVTSVLWGPRTNTSRAKSPWTLEDVVQVFDGHMWRGVVSIAPLTAADARSFTAWLVSLNGQRGTFLLGDPAAHTPRGTAASDQGLPVVDGTSQTGPTLSIRGLPDDAIGFLLAGDYLQVDVGINARLYMVLQDADTDSSGRTTLDIWPPLRFATVDGTPVTFLSPVGVFSLASQSVAWSVRPPVIYDSVSLEVQEVVTRT